MGDVIADIAAFGGKAEWELVANDTPTDPLNTARRVKSESRTLARAFGEEMAKIKGNGDLTSQGKDKARKALATKHLESIAKLRAQLDGVRSARVTAVENAKRKKGSDDRVLDRLAQIEIRRLLRDEFKGDPAQIVIAYKDALGAGDFDTLDAIETAPAIWPGRPSPETIQELRALRMQTEDPRLGQEVTRLSEAISDVGNQLVAIENEIVRDGGVGPGTVEKLAAGND